jgi:regulator of protease activity HflC (stomatin/prohibitin superfamily)
MFEESLRLVVWLVPVIVLAVIILPQMIRILREYERGVIFRLGKLLGTKGPGTGETSLAAPGSNWLCLAQRTLFVLQCPR